MPDPVVRGAGRQDPAQPDGDGLAEGQAETVLLAAVTAQRLDREGWQGEGGVAGRGLERPDRQLLAAATHPSAAVAIGVVGEDGGVDDGERLPELDGAGVQVQVGPFRAAQLAVAGPGRCRRCCLLAASLASGLRLRAGSAKPPIETVVRGWEARCAPPSTPARPPPSR